MLRIDTPTIATQVIELKAIRNRSTNKFVANSMCCGITTVEIESAITSTKLGTKPLPTAVWICRNANLVRETENFQSIKVVFRH